MQKKKPAHYFANEGNNPCGFQQIKPRFFVAISESTFRECEMCTKHGNHLNNFCSSSLSFVMVDGLR